jgi:hypothetical protein
MIFDLNEPEHDLIKAGNFINPQKRATKLFFSASPSAGESSSALAVNNRLATSPMSADTPSHRSSGSISDFLNTTLPSPSLIRIGALERLAAVKNRSLVEPGREAVWHS